MLKKNAHWSYQLLILTLLVTGCIAARKLPLVINTWDFSEANAAAWKVLRNQYGGNGIDALVEGCHTCERLQCDGTVGYGGSPDENGETTLDAMIMDGATMNIGAVAGLRQIKNAAQVARYVLEHTRHTLLVGDLASDFAEMMGLRRESLTTSSSENMWRNWQKGNCQPNFWQHVTPDPSKRCGPYTPLTTFSVHNYSERYRYEHVFGRLNHDTIGMIVMNETGHIFAGTSTNGARYKIPGRVGDSPIPGAGAYADNEVGAAVATGDGDIMMRFLPSLLAVEAMRAGKNALDAAKASIQRITRFHDDFSGAIIVVDRYGSYAAACFGMKTFPFTVTNAATRETRIKQQKCIEP